MESANSKSIRFSALVARCGNPESLTLWTEPHQDKRLMKAVAEHRVLTVREGRVGKKEHGEVGFVKGRQSTYLVFPKSLAEFKGRRVVGIKYDLVKPSKPLGGVVAGWRSPSYRPAPLSPRTSPRSRRAQEAREEMGQESRLFRVHIRFTAVWDTTETVEAGSRKEAREQALKQVQKPEVSPATVTRKAMRVTRL